MKKTRKCISVLLAGMIAASAVPSAFAAGDKSFAQPCVVDYFNSFNGYAGGCPQKFDANSYGGYSWRTGNLKSATNQNGNTYLQFTGTNNNESGMQMKFNETITSGKLHISFDMRIDNTNNFNNLVFDGVDTGGTNNNNNVNDWMAGNGYMSRTPILTFDNTLNEDNTPKDTVYPVKETTQNYKISDIGTKWHKYDIIIDFDNNKLDFHLDGAQAKTAPFNSDLKTLNFQFPANQDPVSMDNIFIKHYPDGNEGRPQIVVDYAGSGVQTENAVIYAAFSEAMTVVNESKQEVFTEDFEAVNVVTGERVSPRYAEKANGAVKLTFRSLPAGTYKIECSAYKSMLDQKTAAASNTFSTVGAAQNVKAENVLVADNFENYNGGMPANAVSAGLDKSYSGSLTAVSGKDGKGLKIDGNNGRSNIIYQLPYAVKSGKLTYEFDVNHTNGLWFTGILGAECFETDTISASLYGDTKAAAPTNTTYTDSVAEEATEAQKQAWATVVKNDLRDLRESTVGVGVFNPSNSSITAETVQAGLTKSYEFSGAALNSGYTNTVDGLTTPANTWNHVKVEIDLDAAVYNITVGETTKTFKVYQDRLRPTMRYKIKNVNGKDYWVKSLEYGIEGISLGKFNGGDTKSDVIFDNLKVYTDSSYNDYTDFDGDKTQVNTTAEQKYNQPASFVKWDNPQHTAGNTYSKFAYGDGKDSASNTSDKALRIAESGWGHILNRPISANTPFSIEFDISPAASQTWSLRLMRKEQLYGTFESTSTTEKPFEAMASTAKGIRSITGDWQDNVERNGWCVLYTGKKDDKYYLKSSTGYVSYGYPGNDSLEITNPSGWNHIKLVGQPQGYTIYVTAYVNGTKLCDGWSTKVPASTEIAAIGLDNGDANSYISIDNLTVKQLNTNLTDAAANNIYVTDANAVSIANGEKTPLSDGLAAKGETVEINFSAPIASADAIKLYKYADNATTEVAVTKTLSDDKKTLSVTLPNDVEVGDKFVFEIPHTIKPQSGSNLSYLDATAVAFEITEAVPAEIKVEEFRLYKYYASGKYNGEAKSGECWAPATADDVENATETDRFKFIAKGYNTGTNTDLYFIRAIKDADGRLTDAFVGEATIDQYGPFTKDIVGEGIDNKYFTLNGLTGKFSGYLWETGTLKPLFTRFNAELPTTPAATPED